LTISATFATRSRTALIVNPVDARSGEGRSRPDRSLA